VTTNLKKIYQATTEESGLQALNSFSTKWDDQYPQISRFWQQHWGNLNPPFNYPTDIQKVIYTTNAIETLNSLFAKQ